MSDAKLFRLRRQLNTLHRAAATRCHSYQTPQQARAHEERIQYLRAQEQRASQEEEDESGEGSEDPSSVYWKGIGGFTSLQVRAAGSASQTNFYDGVAAITECGIPPGQFLVYK